VALVGVTVVLSRTMEHKRIERAMEAEKPEWMWTTCLKQIVTCVIYTADGRSFTGTNLCACAGMDECPRVTAQAKTGEQYELCGPPIHAEESAIKLMQQAGADGEGGVAVIYGHTYMCGECQQALTAVGVRTFVIREFQAPAQDMLFEAKRKLIGEPFEVVPKPFMHAETAHRLGLKPGQYHEPEVRVQR
jgi:deoxycytidylate deaminase